MMNPARLKVAPPDPYVFKSPLRRKIAAGMDFLGSLFNSPSGVSVDWTRVKKIAVLRLDHLGDVLLALPFLESLQRQLPQAPVDFYLGPWAEGLKELFPVPVNVKLFAAPWFDRSGPLMGSAEGVRALSNSLREGGYDAVIDLRGDFRHIRAMKRAGIPVRVGQGITGGRFWLTHPLEYRPGLHEIDRNLDVLAQMGLQTQGSSAFPRLLSRPQDEKAAEEAMSSHEVRRPFIAIHATCQASAKRWNEERWRSLVERLPADKDIVVTGSAGEREEAEKIFGPAGKRVIFAMGTLSLPGLAAFLKKASLFIGVDSAPAHIAAAMGTPVLSLFSGTNLTAQWGPRGRRVTLLQKETSCSPCERAVCPLENQCMEMIGLDEVLEKAKALLEGGQ